MDERLKKEDESGNVLHRAGSASMFTKQAAKGRKRYYVQEEGRNSAHDDDDN